MTTAINIYPGESGEASMTLLLAGSLDAVTAPDLEQYLAEHLGEDTMTLVLDLQRLTFVSSAGLRTFARARKMLVGRGGRLIFVNLSPQVQKVFEIVKAVPTNDVFRNTEELDDYLAAMQRKVSTGG